MKIVKKHRETFILLFLTALVFLFTLFHTRDNCLWGDEAYSACVIRDSFAGIINASANDVHPPLYYLYLKIFCELFGYNGKIYHLASFVPVCLGLLFAVTLFKKHYGFWTACFFVVICGLSPCAFIYNVEIRMYSLAMLFVTLCFFFCGLLISKNCFRNWAGVALFALLAAYTHIYALISVAFAIAATVIILCKRNCKENLLKSIILILVCSLAYLPWLLVILSCLSVVQVDYWMTDIPSFFNCMNDVFGGYIDLWYAVPLLFFILLIYVTVCRFISKESSLSEEKASLVIIGVTTIIGTVFSGLFVSYAVRPLFVTRYLYPLLGTAAMTFSFVCEAFCNRLNKRYGVKKWIICSTICSILLIFGLIFDFKLFKTELIMEAQTDRTYKYISENIEDTNGFITDINHLSWTVLDYYFPDNSNYDLEENWKSDVNGKTVWLLASADFPDEVMESLKSECKECEYFGEYQLDLYCFEIFVLTF